MPAQRSNKGRRLIDALDSFMFRAARWSDHLSAFICAFLILVTTAAVIVYQLGISIPWLDDLLRMLLIWLVYMGCIPLALSNDHISMDAVYLRMPKGMRKAMDVIIALMGIALCGYVAKIGYDSMMQSIEYGELVPSGYFASWPQNLAIPLGFGLMTVAYASFLFSLFTGRRLRHLGEGQKQSEGL